MLIEKEGQQVRSVAYVAEITNIQGIPEADFIALAQVNNSWTSVVKKGEFQIGDKVIYCEIDSFIPNTVAPFLTQAGKSPKEYQGIQGERLKTKKLKGCLSQGFILPYNILPEGFEGQCCMDALGIVKWEPEESANLRGKPAGNFPSCIPKTDQERIQNLDRTLEKWSSEGLTWEVTEKLEGSSMTCYLDDEGNFQVCSRNLSLKEDPDNTFWKVAIAQDIKQKMLESNLLGYALQGELIGEGIQGNIYNLKGHDFYVYDIFKVGEGYLSPTERWSFITALGLKHAPLIATCEDTPSIPLALELASNKSKLYNTEREGVVYKCNEKPASFKVISNTYLLKQK